MNNNYKIILKCLGAIVLISIISIFISKGLLGVLVPYVTSQSNEGNLTFLYVSMLLFIGFMNHLVFSIGNSKTLKFTEIHYKFTDILIPIWSTVAFMKYYKDFTNFLQTDEETSTFTKKMLLLIPMLMLINTLIFWIVLIGGYLYLSIAVGMHVFTDIHTLYILLSILLYLNGIALRSFMYLGILKGMESALYVFKVNRAIVCSVILPIMCVINIICVLLGVIGILPITTIPILNLGFILLPIAQPIITTIQLFIASNEAELNLMRR